MTYSTKKIKPSRFIAPMLLFSLCVGALSACETQRFVIGDSAPQEGSTEAPDFVLWRNGFLFGLAPRVDFVDANDHCQGSSISAVETQTRFVNGLVGALTFGIYAPRTLKIWCE